MSNARKWLPSALSRHGRLVLENATASAFARLVQMLSFLLVMPLAINHLGAESYGIWTVLLSLVAYIAFADGGLSFSLISTTANHMERREDHAVVRLFSTTLFAASVAAFAVILSAAILVLATPWSRLLGVPQHMHSEARTLLLGLVVCTALGLPMTSLRQLRNGLMQGRAVSTWDLVITVCTVAWISVAVWSGSSLPVLAIGAALIPLGIAMVHFVTFAWQTPSLRPRLTEIDVSLLGPAFRQGRVFLVIGITNAVAIQSDQLLISALIGPGEVTNYAVAQRLFILPYVVANIVFFAQWPALSAAAARHDWTWVRWTFLRTLAVSTALTIVVALALMLTADAIVAHWIGPQITLTPGLLAGMASYAVAVVVVGGCSTLLVSLGANKQQITMNVSMMILNIPLSIALVHWFGVSGGIWGTAISYLVCMLVPYAIIVPRVLRDRAAATSPTT